MSHCDTTLAKIEANARAGATLTLDPDQLAALAPILRAAYARYRDPKPPSRLEKPLWDACQAAEQRL